MSQHLLFLFLLVVRPVLETHAGELIAAGHGYVARYTPAGNWDHLYLESGTPAPGTSLRTCAAAPLLGAAECDVVTMNCNEKGICRYPNSGNRNNIHCYTRSKNSSPSWTRSIEDWTAPALAGGMLTRMKTSGGRVVDVLFGFGAGCLAPQLFYSFPDAPGEWKEISQQLPDDILSESLWCAAMDGKGRLMFIGSQLFIYRLTFGENGAVKLDRDRSLGISLSAGLSCAAVTSSDGLVYVSGGGGRRVRLRSSWSAKREKIGSSVSVIDTDYNVKPLAALNDARYYHSMAIMDGFLFAAGGKVRSRDTRARLCTILLFVLFQTHSFIRAVHLQFSQDSNGVLLSSVERLSLSDDHATWQRIEPLPKPVTFVTLLVLPSANDDPSTTVPPPGSVENVLVDVVAGEKTSRAAYSLDGITWSGVDISFSAGTAHELNFGLFQGRIVATSGCDEDRETFEIVDGKLVKLSNNDLVFDSDCDARLVATSSTLCSINLARIADRKTDGLLQCRQGEARQKEGAQWQDLSGVYFLSGSMSSYLADKSLAAVTVDGQVAIVSLNTVGSDHQRLALQTWLMAMDEFELVRKDHINWLVNCQSEPATLHAATFSNNVLYAIIGECLCVVTSSSETGGLADSICSLLPTLPRDNLDETNWANVQDVHVFGDSLTILLASSKESVIVTLTLNEQRNVTTIRSLVADNDQTRHLLFGPLHIRDLERRTTTLSSPPTVSTAQESETPRTTTTVESGNTISNKPHSTSAQSTEIHTVTHGRSTRPATTLASDGAAGSSGSSDSNNTGSGALIGGMLAGVTLLLVVVLIAWKRRQGKGWARPTRAQFGNAVPFMHDNPVFTRAGHGTGAATVENVYSSPPATNDTDNGETTPSAAAVASAIAWAQPAYVTMANASDNSILPSAAMYNTLEGSGRALLSLATSPTYSALQQSQRRGGATSGQSGTHQRGEDPWGPIQAQPETRYSTLQTEALDDYEDADATPRTRVPGSSTYARLASRRTDVADRDNGSTPPPLPAKSSRLSGTFA